MDKFEPATPDPQVEQMHSTAYQLLHMRLFAREIHKSNPEEDILPASVQSCNGQLSGHNVRVIRLFIRQQFSSWLCEAHVVSCTSSWPNRWNDNEIIRASLVAADY